MNVFLGKKMEKVRIWQILGEAAVLVHWGLRITSGAIGLKLMRCRQVDILNTLCGANYDTNSIDSDCLK